MAKKMTIVEQYEAIIGKVEGVLSAEEIAFLQERADLHAKKNASRKPTKTQEENELLKEKIMELMADGVSRTVTDIQKAVAIETNQKASALVRQLRECDLLTRQEVKGKAWFTKA
jgi:hypothetical protein